MSKARKPESKREYVNEESKSTTEPVQISSTVLNQVRIYVVGKKLTLKEVTENALLNYIK